MWLWCAWPCWLNFLDCPWTFPCDRWRAWWQPRAEAETAPGQGSICLVSALWDCTLAGGAIVLHCHQWLLSCLPLEAAAHAAPWPPVHGNLVTCPSALVLRSGPVYLVSPSMATQFSLLSSVCLFWVVYTFLKKEQLLLYVMSTYVPMSWIYTAAKCF